MSGRAKPGQRLQLAPPRAAEHAPTVWVDADGRAPLDDDVWIVAQSAGQIAEIVGTYRGQSHEAVLSRLNLLGYWPERFALSAYMRGET